jgi:hypothetical protein
MACRPLMPYISNRMHLPIGFLHRWYVGVYDSVMASGAKRPDLAAMLAPLARETIAAELPVLDAHGLSMWGPGAVVVDQPSLGSDCHMLAPHRSSLSRLCQNGIGLADPVEALRAFGQS